MKYIPNILTVSRIALALIYIMLLENLHIRYSMNIFVTALFVFSMICLTDIIDGKIARRFSAVSITGSLLDVMADFIFILLSCLILMRHNIIPLWFILIIVFKLVEFVTTSCFYRKNRKVKNNFFVFDYVGRIAAVNFFIIPGIALMCYIGFDILVLNIVLYITFVLVIISTLSRVAKYLYKYPTN